ncbi:metallophosphoesterase [Deinococcus maricopensis]|uniref:Metallophosphoesterase n=1 Tax=Deinococcus maricopensis (strain DSM 21211 / LMG 22137 / NRRL B-23946 / LB-34) TaxID=709986 RepID=E8UBC0_DEIML|nr:metallophosphoesterase [Deinococcus maricopensis]ADV68359.1 metallophosphoesterase [Deinococcus maricopensis DSM 21211]
MTRPVYVLPDLHGRADLLLAALRELPDDAHLVSLGDAIDRGPRSLECAEFLLDLHAQGRATLLMGNHEQMAFTGLKNYRAYQASRDMNDYRRALEGLSWWTTNGGESVRREAGGFGLENFPEGLARYLDALKRLVYVDADGQIHDDVPAGPSVMVVHATPPKAHRDYPSPTVAALWLRPFDGPFTLPAGVAYSVHGHTPVYAPAMLDRQVYLDLGAYSTGRLALLRLDAHEPGPLTVLTGPGNPARADRYPRLGRALPFTLKPLR